MIPSRATAIKLARQAKATMIVIGSYSVTPPHDINAENKTDKQPARSLRASDGARDQGQRRPQRSAK